MFDFQLDYKSRLLLLNFYHWYTVLNIDIEVVFFFVQLQDRDSHSDILNYFSFPSSSTRSSSHNKLVHSSLTWSSACHTFFHRFTRLWNSHWSPLSVSRFRKIVTKYLLINWLLILTQLMHTLYTLFVLVIYVHAILFLPLFSLPLNFMSMFVCQD